MTHLTIRLDTIRQTDDLKVLRRSPPESEVALVLPVLVSAQSSRDVANSIYTAVLIGEMAARVSSIIAVGIDSRDDRPNEEFVSIRVKVETPSALADILDEVGDALDEDEVGVPLSAYDDTVWIDLVSGRPTTTFATPSLAAWFREAWVECDPDTD